MTDRSILAGLAGALININLAVDAVEPGQTLTGVHAHQVVAGGSIAAGVGLTLIYFNFTVDSWWRRGKLGRYCREHWEGNMKAMMMMMITLMMKLSYLVNVAMISHIFFRNQHANRTEPPK